MTLRKANASISNAQDLTAQDIETIKESLGLSTPILTEYPTTDAFKAGQQFIYKGRLWMYHTQAMLDDLGWTTVSEGFPAPIDKLIDIHLCIDTEILAPIYRSHSSSSIDVRITGIDVGSSVNINFIGLGRIVNTTKTILITIDNGTVLSIINGELLTNLEDKGTDNAFRINSSGLALDISDTLINDLFTQLPPTTKTATIDVRNTTGGATCDTTIATTKGYTVLTL